MQEGDLVLCTVEKVTNTITFVRLPDKKEGTIISSEIAPGRIKHMRAYVVPNKKIVCKVLEVSGDHIKLSLRRVNSKEKKEVMQTFKQEQATKVAFNQILKEGVEEIKEKILKDYSNLLEFIDAARKDETILSKYVPKDKLEAIKKITEKRKKKQEIRHVITIKSLEDDGLNKIKKVLDLEIEGFEVSYISAGKFELRLLVNDFKEGKKQIHQILEDLEKAAKENNCEFHTTESK